MVANVRDMGEPQLQHLTARAGSRVTGDGQGGGSRAIGVVGDSRYASELNQRLGICYRRLLEVTTILLQVNAPHY